MKMSADVNEVFTAFSLFQNEMEDVKRDSKSLQAKYAKLEQVLQSSRPILAKHGLGVSQLIGNCTGEHVEIESIILHKSGQFFSMKMVLATGSIPLNREGKPSINRAQFVGLNISYARRYGLLAILGMAQEDEDAEIPQQKFQQKSYAPIPQHSQEIDVRKLSLEQLYVLIKQYQVPSETIDKIKEQYQVKDFKELNESQTKSVVNRLKTTFEANKGEMKC